MKKLALAVAAVALLATAAAAQDVPVLSLQRVALGAGLNYQWFGGANGPPSSLAFQKEMGVGLYAAYNLGPTLSLIGATEYGLDNKLFVTRVGIRVRLIGG